jgi:ceramide glucosyltransferase
MLFPSRKSPHSQRMNRLIAVAETLLSRDDGSHTAHISPITLGAAVACTVWYVAVTLVCAVGYTQV